MTLVKNDLDQINIQTHPFYISKLTNESALPYN